MIPINLATEDELSEAVARRLLAHCDRDYRVGTCYGRNGFGYLRKTIGGWNLGARGVPFMVLTDLDSCACPGLLIEQWLPEPRHPNLLFRVAVREIESWLLADIDNLADFLKVDARKVPLDPESLDDPKRALVELARKSRSSDVRSRISPRPRSTAKQGPDYNGCLCAFVTDRWNIGSARVKSESLNRTVERLMAFEPLWPIGKAERPLQ